MSKKNLKTRLSIDDLIKFIGVFFYISVTTFMLLYIGKVSIEERSVQQSNKKEGYTQQYVYNLHVNFDRQVKIGIGVDDRIVDVTLNGNSLDLEALKNLYDQKELEDFRSGYPFVVLLKKGDNLLEVKGLNKGGPYHIYIGKGMMLWEYFLWFILIVMPLAYLIYRFIFWTIDNKLPSISITSDIWKYAPIVIILLGLMLRIYTLESLNNWQYQHDYQGHVDAIKYYAEHPFEIPQADKSLEFPQQPLYYMSAAVLYNLVIDYFGFDEQTALYSIRYMSLVSGFFSMLLGWSLVRLYTNSTLAMNLFVSFLAFTPLFVFQAAWINNDPFNAFWAMLSIYLMTHFYKTVSKSLFTALVLVITFASFIKVSSLLLALLFGIILLIKYNELRSYPKEAMAIKKQTFVFGIIMLMVFGLTLFKAYIPATGHFNFINSALFGGQVIPYFDLNYFFTFHWFSIIGHGEALVLTNDDVRFSLFTNLYGTMFLDDHVYNKFYLQGGFLKLSAQITYLFGAIYLLGIGAYIRYFKRYDVMTRLLIVPVIINYILIIKLLSDYWVVCNSHFRYFSPTYAIIGLIFVIGIGTIEQRFSFMRKIIVYAMFPFFFVQIYWMVRIVALSS